MIRPLTIVTFLMACGSGLYLYQSKHEVQVLDHTIEKTLHDTSALREQSRLLSAEWTMLNDPERLRQFSDTYLSVKSINPNQFTSLADLDSKLPPVQVAAPTPAPAEEVPVATETPSQPQLSPAEPATQPAVVAGVALPTPPIPVAVAPSAPTQAVTWVPRQPDAKATANRQASTDNQFRQAGAENQTRQVAAEVPLHRNWAETSPRQAAASETRASEPRPEQRSSEQRSSEQRAEQHIAEQRQAAPRVAAAASQQPPSHRPIILAAPRSVPPNAPAYQPAPSARPRMVSAPAPTPAPMMTAAPTAAPYGGSLLGMARESIPRAPRPTPVNATYNSN